MSKSLLDLMRAEDAACIDVRCYKRSIEWFNQEIVDAENFFAKYAEDEAKRETAQKVKLERIESANRIIARETEKMEQSQRELESVRSEIRDYFAMLFEKGGENNG